MSPRVTDGDAEDGAGASCRRAARVGSGTYRERLALVRRLHLPGGDGKDETMIARRRSALVLFLAFVAGLCGGALLSLGASGLPMR